MGEESAQVPPPGGKDGLSSAALRTNGELFSRIFDCSSNAMSIIELANGRIIDVNRTWTEMTGVARAAALGRTSLELGIWADPAERATCIAALERSGRVREHGITLTTRSGPRQFMLAGEIFETGGARLALWECRDVTDLKRSDAERRENEARLRYLSDHLPHGLLYQLEMGADGSRRFTYISAAVERLHGLTTTAVLADAQLLYSQILPEDRLLFAQREAEAQAAQAPFSIEVRYRHPAGAVRWIQLTSAPRSTLQGGVMWDGIETDITDRKLAEENLRESEARLRTMADTAMEGIMFLERGVVIDANLILARMFGYDRPEELIGVNSLEAFLTPESRLRIEHRIRHDIGGVQEVIGRRKDGSTFILQTDARAVTYQGRSARIVACLDVTERKARDDELENYRTHLEELVAERTAALQRAHLETEGARLAAVDARLSAERANQAKSAFLSSMSHEIRTPLNAVLGYAQLLTRDRMLSEAQRKAVEVINRSGEHLLALINDILDMSRLEAGHTTSNPEDVDLHGLLDNIKSMFFQRARDKGLRLELVLAVDLPQFVRLDQRKLRQILLNLLSNAVKFTAEGEIVLCALMADGRLRVTVRDTGCGIAEQDLPRLFQPFIQAPAPSRHGEGSGLGLALSRGFAEVMGGSLSAVSEPQQGTTLTLEVPCVAVGWSARQAPRREAIGLAPGQPAPVLLVAEDHAESRQLLVQVLNATGCTVLAVGDGESAVTACQARRFDLVWMDIDLPVRDGLTAARAIRALPGPAPVIVAFTAAAFASDGARILAGGCDEIVHKPYREDELFTTMERLLGIRFVWRSRAGEDVPPAAKEDDAPTLSLAGLSREHCLELHQAVVTGDLALIILLARSWPDAGLAGQVIALADRFAFDRLLALLAERLPAG